MGCRLAATSGVQWRGREQVENGTRRTESLKRLSAIDRLEGKYSLGEVHGTSPAFTVDGIPALPGESWQEYHKRALAWITIEATRTIPANQRFLPRWQSVALVILVPGILVLAALL